VKKGLTNKQLSNTFPINRQNRNHSKLHRYISALCTNALIKITNSESNVHQENFEITWPVNPCRRRFQFLQSSSHVARRVTREHTRPISRSRTSFCPRCDNRSKEQERRKQKLVLQLVPTDRRELTRFFVGFSSKKKSRKSRTYGTPGMRNKTRS